MAGLSHDIWAANSDFHLSSARIDDLAETISFQVSLDPKIRARNETQQSGCTVLLTGFFEEYLKKTVKAYLCALACTGISFSALPKRMQRTHFEGGGKVLSTVISREEKNRAQLFSGITVDDVLRRLYSPKDKLSDGYYIVWEAFADTQQSPGTDSISGILKSLDVKNVWPSIEQLAGDTTIQTSLTELIEKRNECAHTGAAVLIPTPAEIRRYVLILDKITDAISTLLDQRLLEVQSQFAFDWFSPDRLGMSAPTFQGSADPAAEVPEAA